MNDLIVVHDTDATAHTIAIFADVDLANAARLQDELDLAAGADKIVIDLSHCSYLDSSGISELVRAHRKYGARLSIVLPADSRLDRIFRIANLYGHLPIVRSAQATTAYPPLHLVRDRETRPASAVADD